MTALAPKVGRVTEQAAATAEFERAAADEARVLLVTGEAGIGIVKAIK